MSNDNNELKNNAPCEEKQEARQLTEEELEKVTGGKTGVTPWEGDPVAARLADAPTNLEVFKHIDDVVGSGYQDAVKLAIDEAARR